LKPWKTTTSSRKGWEKKGSRENIGGEVEKGEREKKEKKKGLEKHIWDSMGGEGQGGSSLFGWPAGKA